MEAVMFTIAGIFLYLVSDWIIQRIETRLGSRLRHRSLLFFALILILALGLFHGIQFMMGSHGESADVVNTAPISNPPATP